MLKKVIAIILLVFIGLGVLAYFATKRIEEAKIESEQNFKRDEEYNKSINSVVNRSAAEMVTGKKIMTLEEAQEKTGSNILMDNINAMKEFDEQQEREKMGEEIE